MFARLWPKAQRRAAPSTEGRLIYAVGDIHGRKDLLMALMDKIVADANAAATDQPPVLVFLGDYVDRGPESRGVVECVRAMSGAGAYEVRALMGNHEQVLLKFLDDAEAGPSWAEFGGAETLRDYGVLPPASRADPDAWEAARVQFVRNLPPEHLVFLKSLALSVTYGDYFFVHAGVRPGVPLERQSAQDMLWIRDDFLRAEQPFGKVVVHGHTPEVEAHIGRIRIGVDTGAYATGTLTAVRLDGQGASLLQARVGG